MREAIREADLIEADFVLDCLEARLVEFAERNWRDPMAVRWWGVRGAIGIATLRRLLEQERAGQLCVECGSVIVPLAASAGGSR